MNRFLMILIAILQVSQTLLFGICNTFADQDITSNQLEESVVYSYRLSSIIISLHTNIPDQIENITKIACLTSGFKQETKEKPSPKKTNKQYPEKFFTSETNSRTLIQSKKSQNPFFNYPANLITEKSLNYLIFSSLWITCFLGFLYLINLKYFFILPRSSIDASYTNIKNKVFLHPVASFRANNRVFVWLNA